MSRRDAVSSYYRRGGVVANGHGRRGLAPGVGGSTMAVGSV
jgi:hypothetical protein